MHSGTFLRMTSRWTLRRLPHPRLILLLAGILTIVFLMMAVQPYLENADRYPASRVFAIYRNNNPPPKSSDISQDAYRFPEKSPRAIFATKQDNLYVSAIRELSYEKVIPSTLSMERPYFHPNPHRRFEMADKEILSPSVCSNKTQIVIFILSLPDAVAARKAIRMTWGSVAYGKQWPRARFKMDIRLLFVVGVRSASVKTPIEYSQLRAESAAYNDVLLLSSEDTYSNLTRKMILGFKWVNKNCPSIKYVIKADQDVFVNVPMLWQFLLHYGQTNSIYGHVYLHGLVRREGKWALSKSVVPLTYFPIYTAGSCYVISSDAITKVLDTYYLFPYVRIEDAFITGIVASVAKIDRYNVNGFTYWEEESLDPCELIMDRAYTGNHFSVEDLGNLWSTIEGGSGACI